MKQKRDEYQEIVTQSKIKIASTEEKIRSLNKDIDTYTQEIVNVKKLIENVQNELSSQTRVYDEAMSLNKSKQEDIETENIKN